MSEQRENKTGLSRRGFIKNTALVSGDVAGGAILGGCSSSIELTATNESLPVFSTHLMNASVLKGHCFLK